MYASKTLVQRNNDPYPFFRPQYRDQISEFGLKLWGYTEGKEAVRRPRPEFQHGKLEANAILVLFRAKLRDDRWLDVLTAQNLLVDMDGWWPGQPSQVAHARRVLTLWIGTFA